MRASSEKLQNREPAGSGFTPSDRPNRRVLQGSEYGFLNCARCFEMDIAYSFHGDILNNVCNR